MAYGQIAPSCDPLINIGLWYTRYDKCTVVGSYTLAFEINVTYFLAFLELFSIVQCRKVC